MTKPDRRLRVISPDGTITTYPAPDGRALRRIRDNPKLTDRDKAELFVECPLCGARPGRVCRNRAGRRSWHGERLEEWMERRARQ